jgi:glycerophosphoryl diester phosphodiesterase
MRQNLASFVIAAAIFALPISCMAASAQHQGFHGKKGKVFNVQVGPRPYYLVEAMKDEEPLKKALQQCSEKPLKKTDFSIGHRGAAL